MTKRVLLRKTYLDPLTAGNILFVGDSITTSVMCAHGGYPSHAISYLNTHTIGEGWAESTQRLAWGGKNTWEISANVIASINNVTTTPDYVFLYSGANDDYFYPPEGGYIALGPVLEESWKTAYTDMCSAIHTKFPNAIMYAGKTYRRGSAINPDCESYILNYICPWTDDMVAAIPYLRTGIKGYEVLIAMHPDGLKVGDNVHPSCAGCAALGQEIANVIFHVR